MGCWPCLDHLPIPGSWGRSGSRESWRPLPGPQEEGGETGKQMTFVQGPFVQGDSGVRLRACGPAGAYASVSRSEAWSWVGVDPYSSQV